MTTRERFNQIARFERADDPFFWGAAAWNDTIRRWIREGLPIAGVDRSQDRIMHLLGFENQKEGLIPNAAITSMGMNGNPPYCPAIDPMFEPEVLEEQEEHLIRRDYDGSIIRVRKNNPEAMPQYLEYPVKDRRSWEEYKKRLDPYSASRWPDGWDAMSEETLTWPLREAQRGRSFEERDFPLGMVALSLYGNPRNYMGLEQLSYTLYDDESLVEEMAEWQTYLAEEMLKKVFATGVTLDYVFMWEDMCYTGGSLVSPEFVKRVMAPRYRRITDLLRSNGVGMIGLDSDGNTEELLPIWLDCGINAHFPFEIASNMDPIRLRKQYGKNLIIIGGTDKRNLAKGKTELDAEVAIARELLKDGGYFVNCDHHIPPDVPYKNWVYFSNEINKLSGYGETRRFIPEPNG